MLRDRSPLLESFVWLVPPVRIDRLTALCCFNGSCGAWPFFVRGVICLVIPVSVCTLKKKREERREQMKEERGKRNREKIEKTHKTKKIHRTNCHIMIRKKKQPRGTELFGIFFERSESHRVSNYLADSNSIFGRPGINLESVSARTVS